ncbi:MAG: PAS domain-containing sensor histidine kinase [Proteobacteria bacterium]|nr:PAS domain-containing sensor histidine kinase [Pseudomonadota bacterium]
MTSVTQAAITETPAGGKLAGAAGGAARVGVVGLALTSALVTFLVLANLTPILPTHDVVVSLLLVNLATVVLLLAIIGREVWQVVQARRRGRAGARLHVRIVGLFSIIAAAPAVLVAVVASVTLDRGLDRFFSERTRAMMQNSLLVAEAYLGDRARLLAGETAAMAFDLGRAKPLFDQDRTRYRQVLNTQSNVRGMTAALLIRADQSLIERADAKVTRDFAMPPPEVLASITEEVPQVVVVPEADYVAAAIKVRNFDDTYLFVTRLIDPRVASQLSSIRANLLEYAGFEARRLGVQIAFALMYTVIALIVLLSAVLIGLNFANRLVAPIRRLIGAANIVSTGNLHVQVPVREAEGDIARLSETFNKMTQELRTQRDDVERARDLVDSRRRFTEAVLAGASAGVIGIDAQGRVGILNRSAEKLIGRDEADILGQPLVDIVAELDDILASARDGTQRLTQGQVTITRGGRERNLSVRVTTEQSATPTHGFVVTLDDITELVAAQRTSAWADVARRIAHEIKNPLTPIQLSAERLRRKYAAIITEDRAVFEQCTSTIVRQVDDIRRMVDEFSRFARMPKPEFGAEDVADTVRQVVFLMRVGHADIDIDVEIAHDPMPARFDRRLISQGLTNIIKNATEAIAAVAPAERGRGKILVTASRDGHEIAIDVVDNGVGLPRENRSRLLEPYVTTREKGTGLGLAIVGKILEDHGGGIELHDAAERVAGARGAWLRLRFKALPETSLAAPQSLASRSLASRSVASETSLSPTAASAPAAAESAPAQSAAKED